jgi:hypothetical protein
LYELREPEVIHETGTFRATFNALIVKDLLYFFQLLVANAVHKGSGSREDRKIRPENREFRGRSIARLISRARIETAWVMC